MTTVLVTGGHGQLGRSVARRARARGLTSVAPDVATLDITDDARLARYLDETAPAFVINAAAYTAVDQAESDHVRAFAINAYGAGNVARACAARGIPMLHVSTDYVFDGGAAVPYREDHPVNPLGVYGASKAEGEVLVWAARGCVVRTSWLFAAAGPGFVQTIVRLASDRPVLRVVADQHGCPTWAEDLADALLELGQRPERDSVYHVCNDGPTTWHAFASAIVEQTRHHRALACERIEAITTAEYPTAARRPPYSVLDTSRVRALGIVSPSWKLGLAQVIAEDLNHGRSLEPEQAAARRR